MEKAAEYCYTQSDSVWLNLASNYPCVDQTLSEDECADLYKVALMQGHVSQKTMARSFHGSHRETMKRLALWRRRDDHDDDNDSKGENDNEFETDYDEWIN